MALLKFLQVTKLDAGLSHGICQNYNHPFLFIPLEYLSFLVLINPPPFFCLFLRVGSVVLFNNLYLASWDVGRLSLFRFTALLFMLFYFSGFEITSSDALG